MQNSVNPLTTFDIINLVASLASLILAIVAMWMAVHFQRVSDAVNKETRDLLVDVKTDAKALAQVASNAMAELSEYGKASREVTRQLVSEVSTMRIANLSTAAPREEAQQSGPTQPAPPTSS